MGTGFVDLEKVKVEHSMILIVIAGLLMHYFSKYAAINVEISAFAIFAAMCFAGYMALKAAKEIVNYFNESKQALNTNAVIIPIHDITPVAFSGNSKFPKYSSTASSKSYKFVS